MYLFKSSPFLKLKLARDAFLSPNSIPALVEGAGLTSCCHVQTCNQIFPTCLPWGSARLAWNLHPKHLMCHLSRQGFIPGVCLGSLNCLLVCFIHRQQSLRGGSPSCPGLGSALSHHPKPSQPCSAAPSQAWARHSGLKGLALPQQETFEQYQLSPRARGSF